jgi:hypothetical protein
MQKRNFARINPFKALWGETHLQAKGFAETTSRTPIRLPSKLQILLYPHPNVRLYYFDIHHFSHLRR